MKQLTKTLYDYRELRPATLTQPRYRHIFLLLFWPAFGLLFGLMERGGLQGGYHLVHCALDDLIPFCEWFLLPYLFWFVYLVGMLVYTFFYDVPAFRRYMYFVILSYTATAVIYLVYPTAQALRPVSFAHDNLLTRWMAAFYAYDTNTNVCPSLHVIGSVAVSFSAWDSRRFGRPGWRAAFSAVTALISVSTLFVKQHSALDVLWALPVCAAAIAVILLAEQRERKRQHGAE
jgi:hypothetical protein